MSYTKAGLDALGAKNDSELVEFGFAVNNLPAQTTHQLDSTVQVASNVAHRDGFQAGILVAGGLFPLVLVALFLLSFSKKRKTALALKEAHAKVHALELENARLSGMQEAKSAIVAQSGSTNEELQALREKVNVLLREESERLERWKAEFGGSSTT